MARSDNSLCLTSLSLHPVGYVLGTELSSSALGASVFTHCGILTSKLGRILNCNKFLIQVHQRKISRILYVFLLIFLYYKIRFQVRQNTNFLQLPHFFNNQKGTYDMAGTLLSRKKVWKNIVSFVFSRDTMSFLEKKCI